MIMIMISYIALMSCIGRYQSCEVGTLKKLEVIL